MFFGKVCIFLNIFIIVKEGNRCTRRYRFVYVFVDMKENIVGVIGGFCSERRLGWFVFGCLGVEWIVLFLVVGRRFWR